MPRSLLQIGQPILNWTITDILGFGGEGEVYKGRDRFTSQFVAIKRYGAAPGEQGYEEGLIRFRRCGQIRINHPNVPDPIGVVEPDGECLVIFPFIDGVNLELYVQSHSGRLPPDVIIALLLQVADALQAIHAKGLVHRDLKPGNIMIGTDGRALIIDFGISKQLGGQTITHGLGMMGTPEWMAPEQAANPHDVDPRSDLHALGSMTYCLLTGQPRVAGQSSDRLLPPHELDPSIPQHVSHACMRLFRENPADRFQSAAEFRQALLGPGSDVCACGTPLLPQAAFCLWCGAKRHHDATGSARCLACGAEVGPAAICQGCQRRFSPHDHRFCFSAGTICGTTFRVPEGEFDVGRDTLCCRDNRISRRHCHVVCLDGTVCIQDANSTNRTLVAGHPADRPTILQPGSQIVIAGNVATYLRN